MTIENGASAATNDPALAHDQTDAAVETPQEVEVEYNGKTYSLLPELRDALLRQADYTRKTQELAGQRRAFEAERQTHGRENTALRAHLTDAARIVALNDHLSALDKVDWPGLQARDRPRPCRSLARLPTSWPQATSTRRLASATSVCKMARTFPENMVTKTMTTA